MSVNDTPIVPVHDPDRGFRVWNRDEVYGQSEKGRYVPNLDDAVWDWDTGLWRVIEVDITTGECRLMKYQPPKNNSAISNEDVLLGVDVGYQAESYRVYLDTSVMPHTLAVDSRLHIYGTTADSIKIFQGTDFSDDSKVISAMYDQTGTFLGENIPLELVVWPDGEDNQAVKTPMVGYTLRKLPDGEVVTVVAYDDAGSALSYTKMLVKNTAFIRTTDASRKYVMSIHLESPFLAETDDRVLEFPVNMPVSALPMVGVVTYSDGSTSRQAIDGDKFNLYGLNHFIATVVGQRIPLVLSYKLSENEFTYGASPGNQKHISEKYQATTTEFEESFAIKLFGYPVWIDDVNGYRMEFFLYNLNRQEVFNVTNHVALSSNSQAFNPTRYGVTQRVSYVVDMSKVDDRYPTYKHVQTMEVNLMAPGDEDTTNWTIGFSPNQDPHYGHGLAARMRFVDTDNWKLMLDNGFGSKEEWVRELFYRTQPLYHPDVEPEAPAPNYFVVVLDRRRIEYHIDDWNKELTISNDLAEGETLYLEFIYRTQENDLQLGIAGLPVHQTMPGT